MATLEDEMARQCHPPTQLGLRANVVGPHELWKGLVGQRHRATAGAEWTEQQDVDCDWR